MKHVRMADLLSRSPREKHALVATLAAHPAFLPRCDRAERVHGGR